MIETRLFEVRDRATCMGVMATYVRKQPRLIRNENAQKEAEGWLLGRHGWGEGQEGVYMRPLEPGHEVWAVGIIGRAMLHRSGGLNEYARTLPVAFRYIAEHWHELKTGQVIDVRYILGEAEAPAESDRTDNSGDCLSCDGC